MGLRKTEWLFLTCFNYWIVCRLVRDDHHPYLVYSPGISIQESSEPFRAFLGAILSVVKDVPVKSSAYNPNIKLDTIEEEQDDIDDGSGEWEYRVRVIGSYIPWPISITWLIHHGTHGSISS
jgi:hypothetical protein